MKSVVINKKAILRHKDYARVWVCFFLMPINIYSEYLERITGIGTLVYNIGSFVILLILALPKLIARRRIPKKIIFFSGVVLALVALHIAFFGNYVNEIKQASFVIEFLIIGTLYNGNYFEDVKKTIITMSLIMSADALIQLPKVISLNYNLFNVRQYTMLDKPYYTLIFPLAITFLISKMIEKRIKHKWIVISVIALLCIVLFGIIGSKTALVAAVAASIIMMTQNRKGRKYLYYIIVFIVGIGLFYFGVLHKQAPDFIVSIVYFIRGQYDIVSYAYAQSYFIRFEIVELAFRTFLANPLFGCGFNNYFNYVSARGWQNYSQGITDVESDLLAMFAEGGIIYTALVIWMFFYLAKRLFSKKEFLKTNKYHTLDAIGCLICLIISIIGNDFMSSFFWGLLGIIYGCATKKEKDFIRG